MALCPAIFDGRILPLYVTDPPQAFAERGHEVRPFGGGLAAEQTDHRHSGLLRPRRERPCRRTAEECDELAPPHRRTRGFRQAIVPDQATIREAADVRFGSKADMCGATRDVRFGPLADIRGAKSQVRFAPESGHSRARAMSDKGQEENIRPAVTNLPRPNRFSFFKKCLDAFPAFSRCPCFS